MKVEFLHVDDQFYVLATSDLAARDTRVLKQGETFAIFDINGDIRPLFRDQSGIFHGGTRYLSQYELQIGGQRPLLLHSTLRDDNGTLVVDMTNPDFELPDVGFVPKGSIHIHREKFLFDSRCYEQITFSNYSTQDLELDTALLIASDFVDIFEVRGMKRAERGQLQPTRKSGNFVSMPYIGLDQVERTTVVYLSAEDLDYHSGALHCKIKTPVQGRTHLRTVISFRASEELISGPPYDEALERVRSDHLSGRSHFCSIHTTNEPFNGWLRRSADDLVMMTSKLKNDLLYPYAGIPWFCCPFGRDGILTAVETLWVNPSLALGVLEFLAETQAMEHDASRDAEPGKILHESRQGEMAALGEIPFGRYYGSIDSTPLFVVLGGLYLTRTNDLATIQRLWPHFHAALEWMEKYGDLDGDGFLEYFRESSDGLINQGWKDSGDSIFHADGKLAKGPIALAEVQGYAYMAYLEGASLARAVGQSKHSTRWSEKAHRLKEKFDSVFWLDDLGTYAMALDGEKRHCRVASSNAGQCLFTGVVKAHRTHRLIETLMSPESFSGWGIRTVAANASRYNPMSYHNGSVWPHDVALIAWGMSLTGHKTQVLQLFNGLFKAATYMELERIPEVFCGFPLRVGEAPTLYPTACSPQAWSAGSVYLLVQSLLGISIHGREKRVHLHRPCLPDSIDILKILDLVVGDAKIDLMIQNYREDVSVQIIQRHSGISVTVEK